MRTSDTGVNRQQAKEMCFRDLKHKTRKQNKNKSHGVQLIIQVGWIEHLELKNVKLIIRTTTERSFELKKKII